MSDSYVILGSDSIIGHALVEIYKKSGHQVLGIGHHKIAQYSPFELSCKLADIRPRYIINAHDRGGGIGLHKKIPTKLFMDNITHDMFFIPTAHHVGVEKYINILPNCIYPEQIDIPYKESDLWSGLPEENVAPYSMSKKISMIQADAYRRQYGFNVINLIVTAVYGKYDIFDPEESQVIPSMVMKFAKAKEEGKNEVTFWGSGHATREFIHIDDAIHGIQEACENYNETSALNICSGVEVSIKNLAELIAKHIGYEGSIIWDTDMPEGVARKCLSTENMHQYLSSRPRISLEDGLKSVIKNYHEQYSK